MILSDRSIAALATDGLVDPFVPENLQPASLDVTLSDGFRSLAGEGPIDPSVATVTRFFVADSYVLQPGEFLLGSTVERFCLPNNMVARLEGRSTYGRLGLMVHITAGYIDPGFRGDITLEFYNSGPRPILLTAGCRIGQVTFYMMTTEADVPYGSSGLGSNYQGQSGATGPRPTF